MTTEDARFNALMDSAFEYERQRETTRRQEDIRANSRFRVGATEDREVEEFVNRAVDGMGIEELANMVSEHDPEFGRTMMQYARDNTESEHGREDTRPSDGAIPPLSQDRERRITTLTDSIRARHRVEATEDTRLGELVNRMIEHDPELARTMLVHESESEETTRRTSALTKIRINKMVWVATRSAPVPRSDEDICGICLKAYKPGCMKIVPECGHECHMDCLDRWIHESDSCPTCRRVFVYTQPSVIPAEAKVITRALRRHAARGVERTSKAEKNAIMKEMEELRDMRHTFRDVVFQHERMKTTLMVIIPVLIFLFGLVFITMWWLLHIFKMLEEEASLKACAQFLGYPR